MESPLPIIDYQGYERRSSYVISSVKSDIMTNNGKQPISSLEYSKNT